MLTEKTSIDALDEFRSALADAGLVVSNIVADGKIHRAKIVGSKRESGAYLLHLDARPAGYIENFKTGAYIKWSASSVSKDIPSAQRAAIARAAAKATEEAKQNRMQTTADIARYALQQWKEATPAGHHAYLTRKNVQAHGLRIDARGRLLVPMIDVSGKLWSLQRIEPEGDKRYVKGGQKEGCYCPLARLTNGPPIVLAEGFATAATIRELTGAIVVAAFDSGNLLPVAQALHAKYPDSTILFACDNDHILEMQFTASGDSMPNIGIVKAREAAAAVGGRLLIPIFGGLDDPGTDWNDYAMQRGLEETKQILLLEINCCNPS